jgi:hypothetical protein
LRFRGALLKLESLRPSGGADDRALSLFPHVAEGASAALAGTAGAAIAAAAWARSRAVRLFVVLHGIVTHEARETLRLYGAAFETVSSREEALGRARAHGGTLLPPLDGDEAGEVVQHNLGAELLREATGVGVVVAPAGARASLLAALWALPGARGIALVAADDELPDLPRQGRFPPSVQLRPVSRAACAEARQVLARQAGVLAAHASAMAALEAAKEGGLALIVATGEREFSLEGAA